MPLIGFSGSPWTLATYMVEGGSSRDFAHVKTMAYDQPELMHQLLTLLADAVADYLSAQVRAGAQALQIFDTWGGSLSAAGYREFSLQYMQRVIARLPTEADGRTVPVIVFTKGGGQWLDAIADCGAQAVGIDWTTDMHAARALVGDRVAAAGQYGSEHVVRLTGAHSQRGRGDSGGVRSRQRPCLQPRTRHHAGCESGSCDGLC